jgi:hypothetical protein
MRAGACVIPAALENAWQPAEKPYIRARYGTAVNDAIARRPCVRATRVVTFTPERVERSSLSGARDVCG